MRHWDRRGGPVRSAVYALLVVAVLYGRFLVASPIAVFAAAQNSVGIVPWMRVQSADVRFNASLWLLAGVVAHRPHPVSWSSGYHSGPYEARRWLASAAERAHLMTLTTRGVTARVW
ncbi:hypothetical protein Airi01_006600 [Actinoallomurus iriomotensis]|uniref:Uncharacterized protein n=1 Tax=Actinoallomurus iriomotensis TaxID=478107 RepID=A0A9W6RAS5_9ACTN|nr:hypothetical protein Airi01_006600 [Actinoallomurus iriomotensis]